MKKMKSEHDSSPPRTTATTTAATEPPPHLLDSSSSSSVDILQLKLEAIFHPKFDNENSSDLVIRNTMLRNVASNAGYIEVSLKHSGSLLLWSGKQYYYSKNSTFNSFTKVGEILLLQHFARCHSHHHRSGNSSHGSSDWKMEYEKCSDYIYNNRLTCSFEVVTSILGHHGDIPNKDYLILIAVAHRGYDYSGGGGGGGGSIENASKRPRFYTTNELIKFAQTYRLPHNDTWLFGSRVSCDQLFVMYDSLREVGTTSSVISQLDRIIASSEDEKEDGSCNSSSSSCCAKVVSLYPHTFFQGDILEGIVIRYVPHNNHHHHNNNNHHPSNNTLDEMKELCATSYELLTLIPPSMSIVDNHDDEDHDDTKAMIQKVDLRAMAERDDFESQLDNVLQCYHGTNYRRIRCTTRQIESSALQCIDIVKVANDIIAATATTTTTMSSSSTSSNINYYNQETLDIARLIQTLDRLHIKVSYTLFDEQILDTTRHICIVNVHHDSAFLKYNAYLKSNREEEGCGGDELMLFRGFSIELVTNSSPSDDDGIKASALKGMDIDTTATPVLPIPRPLNNTDNGEKLMLKMKFLPYMIRTFICRNGLHILTNTGISAFENYAITQLSNWNMSPQAMNKWLPFFNGWATYCSSSTMMDMSLPALTSKNYLHHYKRFEELYANGQFRSNLINGDAPTFCGLIVIVGSCKNDLVTLAMAVSSELHCSKVLDHTKINETDMLLSKQRSGGGFICVAEFETPVKAIRSLAKEYQESIFIIIIQRREEEHGGSTIDNNNVNTNNSPKLRGMIQAWKKTKCKLMVELPIESTMQLDVDTTIDYLRNNDTTKDIIDRLKACGIHGDMDERPGLVVYFPSIPGSGKSSLCQDITADTLLLGVSNNDREVVVMEGDQTVGKFYQVVTKQRLTNPSSIVILDKNVTPTSFVTVDTVCRQSQGGSLAVPVLPMGMIDTYVSKESTSFLYPLSLQFLAVCISRVLNRTPATHPGKLDAATETACMVVVKFYCFYCNMSASRLKEKLLNIGNQGKVLFIPFFKDVVLPNLPTGLKEVLEDAVILQTCDDKKICKANKEAIANMENKLRVSIANNRQYIDSLTVSVEESRSVFIAELTKMISSLPNKLITGPELKQEEAGSIKIASLDFDISVVQTILDNLRASIPEIDQYFFQRGAHKTNDEDDESICRFITSVHCTYAHCSEVSQEAMLATFKPLIGTTAEMKVTALLYSEKIAALELEVPNFDPKPTNIFPHITIWCFEGTGAHESNNLPDMVKMNMATRVELTEPVILKGVFSFWYN